jgi:urease accessory protein
MIARLLVCFVTFGVTPAHAHPPPLGITGFAGGLLHPAFVPSHLLAIAALGLLMGQLREGRRPAALGFGAGLGAGLFAMTLGVVPRFMTETVVVLAACAGLLAAWGKPLGATIVGALATATGICVALDSPPETISVGEANRMLAGAGLGAMLLLALCIWIARRLAGRWSGIGARVAGSWIAASAILTLALKLAG